MTTRRLGVRAALVEGRVVPGDVEVDGSLVSRVGLPSTAGDGLAVPGFVDIQVNGFAGVDFSATDSAGYRQASSALARTGVTSFLPTIPTAAPDRYAELLAAAGAAAGDVLPGARAIGVHLEGPFLSSARPGAHRPAWLRAPDRQLVEGWLSMAPVSLMTIAPELDGALDLVVWLRTRGVVVSVGHSDATASVAHRAFDAGATAITHCWNAHRPITSRDPGPGGVALARPDVFVCLIGDLVHVAPETLSLSMRAASGRFILTTDAVAVAGLPEGRHRFGATELALANGAATAPGGMLAGGAGTLDQQVRNAVAAGIERTAAIAAVTSGPARLLGRGTTLGSLHVGAVADVVVLDADLEVTAVLVGGRAIDR